MIDKLTMRSYAKVNFALDVLRRRNDGYHEVRMVMQTIGLYDKLQVKKCSTGIQVTCNLPYLPVDKKNLAYQAAHAFFERTGQCGGVDIHLEKRIPVAAGLAGGSGNAAAVLLALNELYQTGLSRKALADIGLAVGADVPYCIYGGTMLAEGIGERLTRLAPMPHMYIVLVKPKRSISTKKVYEMLDMEQVTGHPDIAGMIQAIEQVNRKEIVIRMFNVLQQVTEQIDPKVKEICSAFLELGAEGTIMSGSGPTVFGVFEQKNVAYRAYQKMRSCYQDVFFTETITERDE